MRVLLAEDDLTTARGVSLMLKAANAMVDVIDTGEEALKMVCHYDYDVVVLDLMLPDMEGYEVIRRMRAARRDTPVLILSGLSRPQAKVKGFAAGADDFITKPFDKAELVARIQAIVRRSKGYSQPGLQVGPLHLNLDSREVSVDGQPVHLTGKEYSILELLTLRRGMVLTKEAFLNHLYGGMDEPEMKIIDVFICKLRKKLAQAGAGNLIGTVWGRGYVMREPVNVHRKKINQILSREYLSVANTCSPSNYLNEVSYEGNLILTADERFILYILVSHTGRRLGSNEILASLLISSKISDIHDIDDAVEGMCIKLAALGLPDLVETFLDGGYIMIDHMSPYRDSAPSFDNDVYHPLISPTLSLSLFIGEDMHEKAEPVLRIVQ